MGILASSEDHAQKIQANQRTSEQTTQMLPSSMVISSTGKLAPQSQVCRLPHPVLRHQCRRQDHAITPRALRHQCHRQDRAIILRAPRPQVHHPRMDIAALQVRRMVRPRIATMNAIRRARLMRQVGVQKAKQIARIAAMVLLGAQKSRKAKAAAAVAFLGS